MELVHKTQDIMNELHNKGGTFFQDLKYVDTMNDEIMRPLWIEAERINKPYNDEEKRKNGQKVDDEKDSKETDEKACQTEDDGDRNEDEDVPDTTGDTKDGTTSGETSADATIKVEKKKKKKRDSKDKSTVSPAYTSGLGKITKAQSQLEEINPSRQQLGELMSGETLDPVNFQKAQVIMKKVNEVIAAATQSLADGIKECGFGNVESTIVQKLQEKNEKDKIKDDTVTINGPETGVSNSLIETKNDLEIVKA